MNERPDRHFDQPQGEAADSRTLTTQAYHRLRADIISGRLKPNEKLRTEHLKKEYDVSSATLREAFALLVADALVVSQPQRGFRVAPMSISDFRDITETRAMMESYAVKRSIENRDDEWEAGLTAAFHRLSRAEERLHSGNADHAYWETCNKRFHEVLISYSDSRWTRHFLSILYRQSERYRTLALTSGPRGRDVHQEHVAIYEAAIAGDAELASLLVQRHIRATLDVIVAVNNGTSMQLPQEHESAA